MALREYAYAGSTYRFDEELAPEGAVLIEVKRAPVKANKSRVPADKGASDADRKPSGSGRAKTATTAGRK